MRPAIACLLLAACQDNLDAPFDPANLDRPFFDCRVQPTITKFCGVLACHGDADRYFHFYSRYRLRESTDETQRQAFLTSTERDHNFAAAQGMVDARDPDRSLLLLKPLEQSAGGYFHAATTLYTGGDVFAADNDPDYQVLAEWIAGAAEDPTCIEPGSNL